MDIRNWPLDKIMQLPDCCFGRRWLVSCTSKGVTVGHVWDIAELAFPERIVLWELNIYFIGLPEAVKTMRLALGDKLPTTTAEMDALEPLFAGLGLTGAEPRNILPSSYGVLMCPMLRMPISTTGRRLVLELDNSITALEGVCVIVVVSSLPTEVPDWLCSGRV